jgi:uncharacterized membrane protein YGL010W
VNDPLAAPLLVEYAGYHQDPRNLRYHEIGIPAIVIAVCALLRQVHFGPIDLAMVAIVAVGTYYVRLVGSAAGPAVATLIVAYALGYFLAWPFALVLFVFGWIFQFVGHAYEGKRPAFLTNLEHLLVGPLFIVSKLLARKAT